MNSRSSCDGEGLCAIQVTGDVVTAKLGSAGDPKRAPYSRCDVFGLVRAIDADRPRIRDGAGLARIIGIGRDAIRRNQVGTGADGKRKSAASQVGGAVTRGT